MRIPLRLFLLAAIGCTKPTDTDTGIETDDTDLPTVGCEDPESILLADGGPSGFERCADGAVNRASAETFPPVNLGEACHGDEESLACTTDADCTDGPNGRCMHGYAGDIGYAYCGCEYACASDDDCKPLSEACVADEVHPGVYRPVCVPAECHADADCDSGQCGLSAFDDGCGWALELVCRASADTCHGTADCADTCAVDDGHFTCREQNCDIGRPLLVDGAARTAPREDREDWAMDLDLDAHDPEAAAHWARIAALEHASVASFARFTLQLLALAAPPELVLAAQAAAADEVRHARIAYGLASKFAGHPIGPGPLRLDDAAPSFRPEDILSALIDEACVGETLGAAEARYTADRADPVLRDLLHGIAEDEARHAALAWKSLRWILASHPHLRDAARARLDAAIARHAVPEEEGPDLPRWGRPRVGAVHRDTLRRVVEPVAAALLA